MREVLEHFGDSVVDFKELIQIAVKLSESQNVQIRQEAVKIVKELFRWQKSKVLPFLSKVKETYRKDIDKAIEDVGSADATPIMFNRHLTPEAQVESFKARKMLLFPSDLWRVFRARYF